MNYLLRWFRWQRHNIFRQFFVRINPILGMTMETGVFEAVFLKEELKRRLKVSIWNSQEKWQNNWNIKMAINWISAEGPKILNVIEWKDTASHCFRIHVSSNQWSYGICAKISPKSHKFSATFSPETIVKLQFYMSHIIWRNVWVARWR